MLTANKAVAWGARLAKPDFVPNFPITPQTEIIEVMADWLADGQMKTKFIPMESEHSVLSAAIAGSAIGSRVFTATSSQGLMLMSELLPIASGLRTPIVMANVSRGLAAPIVLGVDHNDILAMRDFGWVQFHCETCQEVLDSMLIAFKVSENDNVMLPSLVNLDGFVLSFTREPVEIPDPKSVSKFLPERKMPYPFSRQPMAIHPAVLEGEMYTFYRNQVHLAMQNSVAVIEAAFKDFAKTFGRHHVFCEEFMLKGADYVLVTIGSITTQAKAAVRELRKRGRKVGLVKLRVVRPFPAKLLAKLLSRAKAVGVLDRNISPGEGGILYPEVVSALYASKKRPPVCCFITGLGGKEVPFEEFEYMFEALKTAQKKGQGWTELIETEHDKKIVKSMLKEALGHEVKLD